MHNTVGMSQDNNHQKQRLHLQLQYKLQKYNMTLLMKFTGKRIFGEMVNYKSDLLWQQTLMLAFVCVQSYVGWFMLEELTNEMTFNIFTKHRCQVM